MKRIHRRLSAGIQWFQVVENIEKPRKTSKIIGKSCFGAQKWPIWGLYLKVKTVLFKGHDGQVLVWIVGVPIPCIQWFWCVKELPKPRKTSIIALKCYWGDPDRPILGPGCQIFENAQKLWYIRNYMSPKWPKNYSFLPMFIFVVSQLPMIQFWKIKALWVRLITLYTIVRLKTAYFEFLGNFYLQLCLLMQVWPILDLFFVEPIKTKFFKIKF